MIDAIWLVLMYTLIKLNPKKVPLFIIKIIFIATHLATILLSSIDAPREIKKNILQ